MQESYGEGPASHTGPESCVVAREGDGETLTGERAGGLRPPTTLTSTEILPETFSRRFATSTAAETSAATAITVCGLSPDLGNVVAPAVVSAAKAATEAQRSKTVTSDK